MFIKPSPALLLFCLMFCIEICRVTRDSIFIGRVGVDGIPYMYLAVALVMIPLSLFYSVAVKRYGVASLFRIFLWVWSAALFIFWISSQDLFKDNANFPYFLYCGVEVLCIFMPMAFWAFLNERFTSEQGHEIFPKIGVGGILGAIVGGLTPKLFTIYLNTESMFALAGLSLCVAGLVSHSVNKALPESCSLEKTPHTIQSEQALKVPLIRTLTYIALPMWVLIYIIEYCYFSVASIRYTDSAELASFLGMVISLSSLAGLIVQTFITQRIIKNFGVGGAALVYPLALSIGACMLLAYTLAADQDSAKNLLGLASLVVIARAIDLALYFSVQESALHLLFYAVPVSIRSSARAMVSGVIFPTSIGIAGLLLVIFKTTGQPQYNIAFAGVAIAFLLVVLALNITPDYLKARITYNDNSNKSEHEHLLEELDTLPKNDARYVLLQSVTSLSESEAKFALEQLMQRWDEDVLCDLAEIASQLKPEFKVIIASKIANNLRELYPEETKRLNPV